MAEINGTKISDEEFMLRLELGRILQTEGYDGADGELDRSKVENERAKEIIARLDELHGEGVKG